MIICRNATLPLFVVVWNARNCSIASARAALAPASATAANATTASAFTRASAWSRRRMPILVGAAQSRGDAGFAPGLRPPRSFAPTLAGRHQHVAIAVRLHRRDESCALHL